MSIKIALAGNPNCGKTTLFNNLTGSNQYVGNWPGVTVEKKEGKLKGEKDVIIQDLPGIYSLSPYTLEEVVSRTYLVKEKPDAILNIIDGTNIERNLYLTTQLIELGIPVVMAVNMIDLVRKNGDKIDLKKLSAELGCQAVEISALKGEGTEAAAKAAMAAAKAGKAGELPHVFTGSVEHAIAHIEESIQGKVDDRFLRWYAVKLFERDDKVMDELKLSSDLIAHIDQHIKDCEAEMDDDAESIITNQRYAYINGVVDKAVKKKARVEHLTVSDKVDQIVTNRILALPIFALFATGVHFESMSPLLLASPLVIALIVALVVGKPLGIITTAWLSTHVGGLKMAKGLRVRDMFPAACACGIGFTVSFLIASLAYQDAELSAEARFGVLVGSMVAAVISGILLSHQSKRFELEDGTKHKHHTGDEDAMNEVETVLEDGTVVVSQIIGTHQEQ